VSAPVASIVIPCRNAERTLPSALASALASSLESIEVLAVDDGSTDGTPRILESAALSDPRVRTFASGGRGVSAARNMALDAARGEFVFFLDADDLVDPDMYLKAVEAMRRDDADYCRVAHDETFLATGRLVEHPLKRDYRFRSQEEIRAGLLPCFFGYSFDQVRAWYRGEPLWTHREKGVVWAAGFRLALIRSRGIRFDERLALFEDAVFTWEYLLACVRTTSIGGIMYHYRLSPSGSLLTRLSGSGMVENKFLMLERRKALDAATGGAMTGLYAASCVFSLLEILHAAVVGIGNRRESFRAFLRYGRDPVVKTALRSFPLSVRKPLLAASVLACRLLFPA